MCSELGSTGFGVQNDPLPDEPLSGQTVIKPTKANSPEGLPVDQGCPDTGHVADEPTSAAKAFWGLLERQGTLCGNRANWGSVGNQAGWPD